MQLATEEGDASAAQPTHRFSTTSMPRAEANCCMASRAVYGICRGAGRQQDQRKGAWHHGDRQCDTPQRRAVSVARSVCAAPSQCKTGRSQAFTRLAAHLCKWRQGQWALSLREEAPKPTATGGRQGSRAAGCAALASWGSRCCMSRLSPAGTTAAVSLLRAAGACTAHKTQGSYIARTLHAQPLLTRGPVCAFLPAQAPRTPSHAPDRRATPPAAA